MKINRSSWHYQLRKSWHIKNGWLALAQTEHLEDVGFMEYWIDVVMSIFSFMGLFLFDKSHNYFNLKFEGKEDVKPKHKFRRAKKSQSEPILLKVMIAMLGLFVIFTLMIMFLGWDSANFIVNPVGYKFENGGSVDFWGNPTNRTNGITVYELSKMTNQEQCVYDCKHISFHGDVYGGIVHSITEDCISKC